MYHDTKYYVSENGSDRNNGSEKHPFKSVSAAKRAVNSLRFDHEGPIHIIFKDGVYSTDGCVFSAGDSGSDTSPVIYRAENPGALMAQLFRPERRLRARQVVDRRVARGL